MSTPTACLTAATAASSVHNTQPWLFRVDGPEIEVLADAGRRLAVIDPAGRQLAMSVGAAALNLRLAIRARGRLPLHRVLPDPERPDALVAVRAGPFAPPGGTVRALAGAITRRHTSRAPLEVTAVPWCVRHDLISAAAAEGARLTVCDPVTRDGLLAVTRTADALLRRDPDYRAELAAWTGGPPTRTDGVPAVAFAPEDLGSRLTLRDFRLGRPERFAPITARFERHPMIMVLATEGDTRYDWIRAGQALQRVLLTATVYGLVVTPMNQALEIPALRRLTEGTGARTYPQAILRVGYGRPGPVTPRRRLGEVLLSRSPDGPRTPENPWRGYESVPPASQT